MEEYIKSTLSKYDVSYISINNNNDLNLVYNIFKSGSIVYDADLSDTYSFYLGLYFHHVKKDYELMKKYYTMALEKGNLNAMKNLGDYYYRNDNCELMKKYYLMAIDKGDTDAMNKLGYYYNTKEDYELMKKYYHPKKAGGVFLGGVWQLKKEIRMQ